MRAPQVAWFCSALWPEFTPALTINSILRTGIVTFRENRTFLGNFPGSEDSLETRGQAAFAFCQCAGVVPKFFRKTRVKCA